MSKRKKIRATELGKSKGKSHLIHFFLLLFVGVAFLIFMRSWNLNTESRKQIMMKKMKEYASYTRDFFIPHPYTYKVFGDMPLVIRATNLGLDFWNKDFPSMILSAEQETNRLLMFQDELNRVDEKNEYAKKKVVFGKDNLIFNLIKEGKLLSEKTNFDIASGEIFGFWERSEKRSKIVERLSENIKNLIVYLDPNGIVNPKQADEIITLAEKLKVKKGADYSFLLKKIKKFVSSDQFNLIKKNLKINKKLDSKIKFTVLHSILDNFEKIRKVGPVLPPMKNLKPFIPFAKPKYVLVDDKDFSVKITNINTSIPLNFFKEAIFLELLRRKLPEKKMNYLIYLGNRHGIWKLPKKYIRWTVSIDNPYLMGESKMRGAIQLFGERGAFVITRKLESSFEVGPKEYDLPVDFRTGLPVKENLAALVLDKSPIKARMLSYALFVSNRQDVKKFEKTFPKVPFLLLKNIVENHTLKVNVGKKTALYLDSLKKENVVVSLNKLKTLIFKYALEHNETNDKSVEVTMPYFLRKDRVYVPNVSKKYYLSLEGIKKAKKERKERIMKSFPTLEHSKKQ